MNTEVDRLIDVIIKYWFPISQSSNIHSVVSKNINPEKMLWQLKPLLLTWINFNPSMD